jgi:hypothetical protein
MDAWTHNIQLRRRDKAGSEKQEMTASEKTGCITLSIVAITVFAVGYSSTDGSGMAIIVSLGLASVAFLGTRCFQHDRQAPESP